MRHRVGRRDGTGERPRGESPANHPYARLPRRTTGSLVVRPAPPAPVRPDPALRAPSRTLGRLHIQQQLSEGRLVDDRRAELAGLDRLGRTGVGVVRDEEAGEPRQARRDMESGADGPVLQELAVDRRVPGERDPHALLERSAGFVPAWVGVRARGPLAGGAPTPGPITAVAPAARLPADARA